MLRIWCGGVLGGSDDESILTLALRFANRGGRGTELQNAAIIGR